MSGGCYSSKGRDQLHINAHDFGMRCWMSRCVHTFGHVVYLATSMQLILDGFDHPKPSKCTLIDIHKAFDTRPRHTPIQKDPYQNYDQ